jgi:pimeloyl-ACP methyl ester carboxylesterase
MPDIKEIRVFHWSWPRVIRQLKQCYTMFFLILSAYSCLPATYRWQNSPEYLYVYSGDPVEASGFLEMSSAEGWIPAPGGNVELVVTWGLNFVQRYTTTIQAGSCSYTFNVPLEAKSGWAHFSWKYQKASGGVLGSNSHMMNVTQIDIDLKAGRLEWNLDDGGIDFTYEVLKRPTSVATSAQLYWASAPDSKHLLGKIQDASFSIPANTFGVGPVCHVFNPANVSPPIGTTCVLLHVDAGNRYLEADEDNNFKDLQLTDLVAEALQWNAAKGGLDFSYRIDNGALYHETTASLYWANGPNWEDRVSNSLYDISISKNTSGSGTGYFPQSAFLERPGGATHLIVKLDSRDEIVESSETNNVSAIGLLLPVVVLVRGLQSYGWDTFEEYWGPARDFLRPYFDVWVCDKVYGRENVVDSARALHEYIRQKVSERASAGLPALTEINIVGHSYGGLISRLYRHNRETQWTQDPRVTKLVTLSTPHCGSYAADSGKWLGWIPYHNNSYPSLNCVPFTDNEPAMLCLTPDFVQNIFNVRVNDRSPSIPFHLFGADQGCQNPRYNWVLLDHPYVCGIPVLGDLPKAVMLAHGGPWYQLLVSPTGTYNPNDGAVTVLSAHGYRWEFTEELLPEWEHYNTERQVGGEKYLVPDDHESILANTNTLAAVLDVLQGRRTTVRWLPGLSGDCSALPPLVSVVAFKRGTVSQGQLLRVPVTVDDCGGAKFFVTRPQAAAECTLTSPEGFVFGTTTTNALESVTTMTNAESITTYFSVQDPMPGTWTVKIQSANSLTNEVDWGLTVTESSDLQLDPKTAYCQNAGQAVLKARLTQGTQAVAGASIIVDIQKPNGSLERLPLYDDGAHGDGAASDGLYANQCIATTATGIYMVRYNASGTNALGHDYARSEAGSFQIAPQSIALSGSYSEQGVYSGVPAKLDKITVNVGVTVYSNGIYSVSAILANAAGNQLAATSSAETPLSRGSSALELLFNGDELRRATNDGPYTLTEVAVWDHSTNLFMRADFATNAYQTAAYKRQSFNDHTPPAAIHDLAVASLTSSNLVLQWTAPDNEGVSATTYIVRCQRTPPSLTGWDSATVLTNSLVPSVTGATEKFEVTGLSVGEGIYFCVRSTDATGNESELSNEAVAISQMGSLRASVAPPEAAAAGAQWRVDGGEWLNSNATAAGLVAVKHEVTFKRLPGWLAPSNQTVTILINETSEISANYQPSGCAATLLSPTLGATIAATPEFAWIQTGGCASRLCFTTDTNQTVVATITNIFRAETNALSVPQTTIVTLLGDFIGDQTFYWTVCSVDDPQPDIFAAWQAFKFAAPRTNWIINVAAFPRGGNFAFSFDTLSNQSYTVQANANLAMTNWVFFTNMNGNGSLMQVVVPSQSYSQRFFRVRQP